MMMLFFFLVFLLRRGERMLASCIVFMLREDVGVLFAVGKKHAAAAKAEEGAGKEAAEQRAWDTDCAQLLPGGWVGAAEGHGAEDALACYLPKDLYDAGLEEEVDCKTLSRGTKGWICYTSEMMRAGAFAKYKDTKHTETMDRAKVAADKQEGIQGKFARKRAIAWLLAGGKAKFKALEKRREQYAKAVADKEKVAENRVLSSWRRDVMPALTGRYVDESTGTAKWEEVPEDQRNSCTCPGGEEGERQDESGEEERGKVEEGETKRKEEEETKRKEEEEAKRKAMEEEEAKRKEQGTVLAPTNGDEEARQAEEARDAELDENGTAKKGGPAPVPETKADTAGAEAAQDGGGHETPSDEAGDGEKKDGGLGGDRAAANGRQAEPNGGREFLAAEDAQASGSEEKPRVPVAEPGVPTAADSNTPTAKNELEAKNEQEVPGQAIPKAGAKQRGTLTLAGVQHREANSNAAPQSKTQRAGEPANNGAKKPTYLLRGSGNLLRDQDELRNVALIIDDADDVSDDGSCCR